MAVGRVAEWRLNDVGFGPSYDGSGFARDLTFYGDAEIPGSGAGQNLTGLRLDGTEDYVSPDVPVLYTDQSFTVSAWVRPTVTTGVQAFLTQFSDGAAPGFSLDHSAAEPAWRCRMPASSTDTSATTTTVAQAPALDTTDYHHLVCVFDAQSRELRLYLDDQLKDTAAMDPAWQPWRATGSFVIGTGQHESPFVDWTHGDLDEVRIFQGVVADVTRID
jgi:hypothetical protein